MNPQTFKALPALFAAVNAPDIYQATKYLSPTLIVNVTRNRYHGKCLPKTAKQETVRVTMGRPNYRQRQFIRHCQRAKEPFPVKKIQLRRLT